MKNLKRRLEVQKQKMSCLFSLRGSNNRDKERLICVHHQKEAPKCPEKAAAWGENHARAMYGIPIAFDE